MFKFCNDLIPHGVLLQKFKLANLAVCQHCNEVDVTFHFLTCIQANTLGSAASHEERLAGLILLSETVNHITVTRKKAQDASPAKLAAILAHRMEVTAKSFPEAGTILATWAGDLRTWSQSPSQGVSRPLPTEEQDGDSLQLISVVCGHRTPLYSTSNFTH